MYRWMLIILFLPAIVFGQIEQPGGVSGGADADSLLGIPMQDTTSNLYDNFIPKYNLAQNRFDWEADVGAAGGTTDTIGFVFDAVTKYQVDKALKINLGIAFADDGVSDSSGIDTVTVYLDTTWLNTNYQIATAYLADRATADASGNTITSTYQPLETTLTDIADGTIAENLVNTANPWADNEIASSANWNTAYGWGDHGAQNYLDDDVSGDVDSDDIANQTIVRADIDSTVGVTLGDDSFIGNSNEADSEIATIRFVQEEIKDSLEEYSLTSAIAITYAPLASPTFTTDIETPLVIGGTTTTSDLSFKTTLGVGATGADMHFLVGNNGGTEAMTILNNGNVGIGINSPSSIFHIKADVPGTVGSHPPGQLIIQNPTNSVYGCAVITGYESDAAGNPDQQLWYLGSSSSSNSNIIFLNRRNSKLELGTNGVSRMTIDGGGYVGIGTASPPERLSVVGNIATGDTAAGDVDVYYYFSTDGSWTTEYLKWDDGLGEFQLSDDLEVDGLSIGGKTETGNKPWMFNIVDPDGVYAIDHEISIDPRTEAALTITRIDVTLNADPTTELEFSLKYADAFIGFANAVVIDDTATVAGVTTVTGGFGDATVPANKCIYLVIDADPDDNITQASFKITWDFD